MSTLDELCIRFWRNSFHFQNEIYFSIGFNLTRNWKDLSVNERNQQQTEEWVETNLREVDKFV